jgi:hypothetical protein
MGKKKAKDKNDMPDPSLMVVEPTIQHMSGKNSGRKMATQGKNRDRT